MKDLNDLHRRFCPTKCLNNFWRSDDFKAAEAVVTALNLPVRKTGQHGHKGSPSQTLVHPLIAAAFLRWADKNVFYERLNGIMTQ